ncbi:MAG TPA: pitrilysin family protein [Burkholderiaceae bacterium]
MKKLMLTTLVLAALSPAVYAQAPAAQAAALPPFGADKPIPVPKIAKAKLANGMEIWVVPRNGLPRVDYVLAVRGAGLAADDAANPGFARMLAGLLNEGTAKRTSRQIAEAAQGMGGGVSGGVVNDGIVVSANALASNAGPMMQLLAEVARTPNFPSKEVALAKANALQALKVSETTPGFRAERAMGKAVYGSHPYGNVDPTVEAINSTTEDMLRQQHARRFRPERALLVVTGKITEAEGMKLAKAAFGDWKATGEAMPEVAKAPAEAKPSRILLQRAGSVQSTVRMGRPAIAASTDDYVPLRLTSTILGGGFSSRVNLKLREEKGYTYGASAGARFFREGGGIVGGADVRNEVSGAAIKEFHNEYRRIGAELVPDAEMQMNKRYVAGSYLISNQMQRTVAATLANNWLIGLPSQFLGEFVPKMQKVSAEQVREMGKKYFAPEAQTIVVVGDPGVVGEQLKEFGDFTVTDK